jgi:hypothetical protein
MFDSLKTKARASITVAGLALLVGSTSFAQQFRDVSKEVGFSSEPTPSWGNPIWGDLNNDGFLDVIVPVHNPHRAEGPFVYRNNGGKSFTDIGPTCGILTDIEFPDWHGFAFGDFDRDGKLDLYIAIGAAKGELIKRDLLFRGRGNGNFENVTQRVGLETSKDRGRGAFWVDYDNDGKLELFVKNFRSVNRLYKRKANGVLTPIEEAAGLAYATGGKGGGFTCSFADYDNDGVIDLACGGGGDKEALYRRNRDGKFIDVTLPAGLRPRRATQGIAWGDYNNDGLLDLYLSRGSQKKRSFGNTLYRNNGNGTFSDATEEAAVVTAANTWAAIWGDYDNDGFLDLFVACAGASDLGVGNANLLYHNNGNGTFTNRAAEEGVVLQDNLTTSLHKTAAWGDYDNDGFLDLIIKDGMGGESEAKARAATSRAKAPEPTSDADDQDVEPLAGLHRLFKNTGNSNHFLTVNLTGAKSNSRGIGARVTVTYSGGMSFRQNNGGGGGELDSQGSQPLHFGIGAATEASIKVVWPSGIVDTLPSVAANSTITIVEGRKGPDGTPSSKAPRRKSRSP